MLNEHISKLSQTELLGPMTKYFGGNHGTCIGLCRYGNL